MKRPICLVALLSLTAYAHAQDTLNLNGTWQFRLAPTSVEAQTLTDFHRVDFETNDFSPISVPSCWAIEGFEEPVYQGFKGDSASIGFYRHTFRVPSTTSDRRYQLEFGGVWSACEVWLNGNYIDRHEGGFTTFRMDVTRAIKAGEENLLAVKVIQASRDYRFDTNDDWSLGGIYRDVKLFVLPKGRWIEDVSVTTDLDLQYVNANLDIRVLVADQQNPHNVQIYRPNGGHPYTLSVSLIDKEGKTILNRNVEVESHAYTGKEVHLQYHIEHPQLWNAETPNLYDLSICLVEDGKISHRWHQKIGFREIETDGGVLRINGQAVKLRGVNRHDEWPTVGRATTRQHWLHDLTMMKEANINYLRLCHYQHAKGFIEMCDSIGMYVGAEVGIGGGNDYFYQPSHIDGALQRTYETVSRDRNNASVIYWSVGNEDPLTQMHLACIRLTKGIDPTRLVLIPWRFEETLPGEVDLLSVHYWTPGLYEQLAAHSSRPIISTEYTHAYGTKGFGGLAERWHALTRYPSGAGAAVWMWADQGVTTPTPRKEPANEMTGNDPYLRIDSRGWDGIVDSYRNPTDDYYETKAVYAPIYPLASSLEFIPGEETARILLQNDYDFTDLNQFKIEWQIFCEGHELTKGIGCIDGKPHTSAVFSLPLDAIEHPAQGLCHYVWLTIRDAAGHDIARHAIRLIPKGLGASTLNAHPVSHAKGIKEEFTVGKLTYRFDARTGLLDAIVHDDFPLAQHLRPTLWRPLDSSETLSMKGRPKTCPDLNLFESYVKAWDVRPTVDGYEIEADVECLVDANNRFKAHYNYVISTDGSLTISYSIDPSVEVNDLPHAGLSINVNPSLTRLNWLGQGPYDAYSNRCAASILGYWETDAYQLTGTKKVERVDCIYDSYCLSFVYDGYLEHEAPMSDVLHLVSTIYPRPEKGRSADEFFEQTHSNQHFVGRLRIELKQ